MQQELTFDVQQVPEQPKPEPEIQKSKVSSLKVENIDDLTLFLINFAEKRYPCASYIDKPNNARDIMTKLAQGNITNLQGLK